MKKSTPRTFVLISILALVAIVVSSCTDIDQSAGTSIMGTPLVESTATQIPVIKTYPEASPDLILYPISSLYFNRDSVVNTEGYVVYQQQNPDCPDGAQLKPCQRSYIIVSENNLPVQDIARLPNQQMVIQVDNPLQFSRLTNYRFTITDLRRAGHFEAKLLAYSDREAARKVDYISDEDEKIIRSIFEVGSRELACNYAVVDSLFVQISDKMLLCQTNADCVPAYRSCGRATTVNKIFKPVFEYLDDASTACYECAPILGEITNIHCENDQCKADFVTK